MSRPSLLPTLPRFPAKPAPRRFLTYHCCNLIKAFWTAKARFLSIFCLRGRPRLPAYAGDMPSTFFERPHGARSCDSLHTSGCSTSRNRPPSIQTRLQSRGADVGNVFRHFGHVASRYTEGKKSRLHRPKFTHPVLPISTSLAVRSSVEFTPRSPDGPRRGGCSARKRQNSILRLKSILLLLRPGTFDNMSLRPRASTVYVS